MGYPKGHPIGTVTVPGIAVIIGDCDSFRCESLRRSPSMTRWRARLAAHLETWRPYTSCYVGLVGLAGACQAGPHPGAGRLAAAWAIPTMGWLAGLYGGDYFDRELDALSKPQRPIPSGRLGARTALGCMAGLIAVGAALTAALNWHALALVACAAGVGISYSRYFKAKGLAGNLARGSITGFALLFGDMVAGGRIGLVAVGLAAVVAVHDSGSNLVGTLRDIEGDRAGGYITYPVRHGAPAAVSVVGALTAAWTALALAVISLSDRGWQAVPAAALAVTLCLSGSVAARLYRRRASITRSSALRMHEILCIERILLASSLAAWGGYTLPVLAIGAGSLVVTWLSQLRLRSRHEFPDAPFASHYMTSPSSAQAQEMR